MSEWTHFSLHGIISPRKFLPCEKMVMMDVFRQLELVSPNYKGDVIEPGAEWVFTQLRYDSVLHDRKENQYPHEWEWWLLRDEEGTPCGIPILPFTPYGSEGSLDVHISYKPVEAGFPASLSMNDMPQFLVYIGGGMRDRNVKSLPYVRLWWRLLCIWWEFNTCHAFISHQEGEDSLTDIYCADENGNMEVGEKRALHDAITLTAFGSLCADYNKYKAKCPVGGYIMSFDAWYNYSYVPANGEILTQIETTYKKMLPNLKYYS